eukprot:TRINITY_DN72371_c0_g1_i1.p1 TRINITY_DN72371_c0_g1~~TRINITY_DN72371_c0_g1_i1.p1  ORF type:complete len:235 (+),score=55.87 TRINITY_DN72371_c0_g1_i1:55-759(+)
MEDSGSDADRAALNSSTRTDLQQVIEEINQLTAGKHPEFTAKASGLSRACQARLDAVDKFYEARFSLLANKHDAERKAAQSQHDAELAIVRETMLNELMDKQQRLTDMLAQGDDYVEHRVAATRRATRSRPHTRLTDKEEQPPPSYAFNKEYIQQPIAMSTKRKLVLPMKRGLQPMNLQLNLKQEEILHDIQMVKTCKRPPAELLEEVERSKLQRLSPTTDTATSAKAEGGSES